MSVDSNKNTTRNTLLDEKWWKEAVIYQIYPRSFKDSNSDGIGDLQGIISKLEYLQSLRIDAIWLSPIYESPNDDNGYDISDYRKIMKDFGTMEDFDLLLQQMHEKGIKLVMDLVFNHSSDEHEWFLESKKSRTNKYRDYYYWWPAEKGKPPYRWSWFDVNSDAWKYDATTDSYYLHYFSKKQPDLNWNNPKVREELYDIMRFWLDKGVDGFRMDAFQFISKDPTFPELPNEIVGFPVEIMKYYGKGAKLHDYIQEMNREVLSHYPNVMSVSEGAGDSPEAALQFVAEDRKELNIAYHFESVEIGSHIKDFGLVNFKDVFLKYDNVFKDTGWLSIFLANHDQPRMVAKFATEDERFRIISSKMLSTLIFTMRGTPFYYQGDELGMTNIRFDAIEDYDDVDTKNRYQFLKNTGGNLDAFLDDKKQTSRDNSRTPFQWDNSINAGFSDVKPWLKVNPNFKIINASAQENNPNSTLNYFRTLVQFRKTHKVLIYGKFAVIDQNNESLFAYTRELNDKKMLIVLNFSEFENELVCNLNLKNAKVLLGNYDKSSNNGNFKPYEAVVFEII